MLVYLGFAEAGNAKELAASLDGLRERRDAAETRLIARTLRRESIGRSDANSPASMDKGWNHATGDEIAGLQLAELSREIGDAKHLLSTLEKQVSARTRSLPLYLATLETDSLTDELRARRDHPMHALLRRMYHEKRSGRAK